MDREIAKRSNSVPDAKRRQEPRPQASQESCPFCESLALTDRVGARFRFACTRCGLLYELTAAAHRRAPLLPPALVARIRAENEHGRAPCISTPDLDSFADDRLSARLAEPALGPTRRAGGRTELAQQAGAMRLG